MDMNIYASWAGFGFFMLLALGFAYFLTHLSNADVELAEAHVSKREHSGSISFKAAGDVIALFNKAYYLSIALVLVYVSILLLLLI